MMIHTKIEIDQFLRKAFFGVLTFPYKDGLESQLMIFSHNVDGEFYLSSQNNKEIFKPISENPKVSILIYKEEDELSNICQLCVKGIAQLLDGFDDENTLLGYEIIGEKSPYIGNIPKDKENRDQFTLIKVEAKEISYITFDEMAKQISPTTLKRS